MPHGLQKKFPANNLQLMVQSGAKGTSVSFYSLYHKLILMLRMYQAYCKPYCLNVLHNLAKLCIEAMYQL